MQQADSADFGFAVIFMHKCVLPGKLIVQLDGRPVLSYRCEHGLQCNRRDLVFTEKARKSSICALEKSFSTIISSLKLLPRLNWDEG